MKAVSALVISCSVYGVPLTCMFMLHMHCNIPCMFDHWAGPVVHLLPLKSSMVESIDKHTLVIISFSYKICLPLSLSQMLSIFSIDSFSHSQYTQVILHPFTLCVLQRDGIYRESILEHFLPISKQTPKPSASIEY